MPPKQKRKASYVANFTPKPKKQKIVDKDPSIVDSGFQNINHDIAKKLLDHLRLSLYDLKALSETCSSWHTKITTYLREMWTHTLPFTHQNFIKKQKIETMAAIGKARKYTSDIQILEFNESVSYHERTISIPWCPYIVVVVATDGSAILDLRKQDPIVPLLESFNTLVATNIHRKQLLVSKSGLANKEDIYGPSIHTLCLYNISEDGKVDLVKKLDIKNNKSPKIIHLRAWKNEVEIYNDSKVEIYDYPGKLGRAPDRSVLGFFEHQGTLKFVVQGFADFDVDEDVFPEETPTVTLLYDTKTRQHVELPIDTEYKGTYDISYINDSLQLRPNSHAHAPLVGSCNLEPVIQRQVEGNYRKLIARYLGEAKSSFTLSPDGNRMLEYRVDELDAASVRISLKDKSETRSEYQQNYHTVAESKILFFYEEPKDEREVEVAPVETTTKRKKKSIISNHKKKQRPKPVQRKELSSILPLNFFWLSNEIVVATNGLSNRIAILDFRYAPPEEGFKSFELPFLDKFRWTKFARLSDTSFVILRPDLVGFKITV